MPVLQTAVCIWDVLLIVCVGEGDCMCEIVAGQFNIFGAIEEKIRDGFRGIFARQEKSARAVDTHDRESF